MAENRSAADLLAELVEGLTIVVGVPLPEHGRRLLAELGVDVVVRGHSGHGRRSLGCGVERTFQTDSA